MKNLLNAKLKDMKAITLIALVITIVVLIILAGVLISLTLGNNGIFQKAKKAKEDYANAAEYEETEIAKISNEIGMYIDGNRDEFINYSENEQLIGKWIDNKNIYRKVIKYKPESGQINSNTNIPHNIVNLDFPIRIYGMAIWNDTKLHYNSLPASGVSLQTDDTNIDYRPSGFNCDEVIIIIEYTKK